MKRIILIMASISSILSCSVQSKDDSQNLVPKERKPIILTRSGEEVVARNNVFAFDLFRNISAQQNDQNVFISPFSVQAAFSMLIPGANGNTREQIISALGYKGLNSEEVGETYKTLVSGLLSVDNTTKLAIANSIWLDNQFSILDTYKKEVTKWYDASVVTVDFSKQSACDAINSWCSDKTNGLIKSIMDSPNPDLLMMLINALYFKGIWDKPFDPTLTEKDDFTTVVGAVKQLDFMNQYETFGYGWSDDAAMVCLPFGNSAFELDVVLPDKGVDFEGFLSGFSSVKFDALLSNREWPDVELYIPKLDLSFQTDKALVAALKKAGIIDAFGSNADFTKLSQQGTMIGSVVQKAVFKMDETGAEAAAVTDIGMVGSAAPDPRKPVVFKADRPFIFIIREISTKTILFTGAYRGL